MARSKPKGMIRKWWADNPDLQYPITAYASIIFAGSTIWGFLFVLLGGATDPEASSLVPISWGCLIVGGIGSFFLLPEFFYYISLRSTFEEIIQQDSRSEIIRRRKELEDAAELLGSLYRSRVLGVYRQMEIKPNRRWKEAPSRVGTDLTWWSNTDSKLSRILPNLHALKNLSTHRLLILFSGSCVFTLIFESAVGGLDGATTSINDVILGNGGALHPPPHLDPVSGILLIFLTMLLWLTSPAPSELEEFD